MIGIVIVIVVGLIAGGAWVWLDLGRIEKDIDEATSKSANQGWDL